jgi:outer membrane protein OmpA-like peptidoglycan-associated protein
MTWLRVALTLAAAATAAACGSPRPVVTPAPPRDLIVLAPHPEGDALGAAVVTAAGASVDLTAAGASVTVAAGQAPPAPVILSADDIARLFGDALGALPPPARRFVLYFELGNDTLTPESQAQVPAILALVAERGQPDVAIIGHTDTTGAAPANVTLGLRRATLVRDRLVAAGLDGTLIEVASHGESNPLEPTPDNTGNARNRRVEVTVR